MIRYILLLAFTLSAQDEGIDWLDNYPAALKIAKETRKPLFVEFRCEA